MESWRGGGVGLDTRFISHPLFFPYVSDTLELICVALVEGKFLLPQLLLLSYINTRWSSPFKPSQETWNTEFDLQKFASMEQANARLSGLIITPLQNREAE